MVEVLVTLEGTNGVSNVTGISGTRRWWYQFCGRVLVAVEGSGVITMVGVSGTVSVMAS